MYSTGHIIWIIISLCIIVTGFSVCKAKAPKFESLIKACFALGLFAEFVKIFCVAQILPVVESVTSMEPVGKYSPYIANNHMPLETCSLQLLFYAIIIWSKNPVWKHRFTVLVFVTGTIGGILGIGMAYIATSCDTTAAFFSAPRVWEYFLYHSMSVIAGLYAGFCKESSISIKDMKGACCALISLDVISIYINALFAIPVYEGMEPVALLNPSNFFSSYNDPLGLVLTEKWQWMAYLAVRFAVALLIILALFLIHKALRKNEIKS